jgi:cell division septation protein DedD
MPISKAFLASAVSLALVASGCSGSKNASSTTTTTPGGATGLLPLVTSAQTSDSAPPATELVTIPSATLATASTAPTTSPSSSTSSTTNDWEVVGGIFTTKTAAQSQIDKLTAAKFTGFSIKVVGAKFAAVLPGLTNTAATTLAAKINTAGTATATTFHLTTASTTATTVPGSSSTTKDWEVVGGIFTTKTAAQTQIDKLTAAKFTGFSIKVVGAKFAAVLPGLTNTAATTLAAKINTAGTATATTFHLTASSTTATATTTTVASTTATNYEVVDGIFTTKTAAQAQIDKLTAATYTGFTIKPTSGKFAVVRAGMTKADASALVTKIDAANLGPSRIKAL